MSENMRNILNIFEDDYQPPISDPDINYSTIDKKGKIDKVVATLSRSKSKQFTDLAKKIQEAKELSEKVKKLEEEIKGEAREAISGLFKAEDEVYTRLIETASFSLQLSKIPEPTVTVKYSQVIKELRNNLTPELIKLLDGLEYKFRTVTQKQPSLKFEPKNESLIEDSRNNLDKLTDYSNRYLEKINQYLVNFDQKLGSLENEINEEY